jgi:hypothetical protein
MMRWYTGEGRKDEWMAMINDCIGRRAMCSSSIETGASVPSDQAVSRAAFYTIHCDPLCRGSMFEQLSMVFFHVLTVLRAIIIRLKRSS